MEESLINDFLQSLRLKGRNPVTVAEYGWNLASYVAYLGGCDIFSFFAAPPEIVTGYMRAVKEKKYAAKTVWKKLHAVHVFYEWLKESGQILLNPLPNPKFSTGLVLPRRVPCAAVLNHVYKKLRGSPKLPEQRDYVAIDLAYSCGLRRCELHGLNINDICPGDGTIRVKGKRGKERVVPVGPTTLADLLHYIYHVRPKILKGGVTNALLVSWMAGGKRMHLYSINAAFRRLRKRYGFDRSLVPHGLRHAFATDLIKNGAPVQDVSEMLGHVKLETTQIYTRLAARDVKNHHQKYHPRG